MYVLRLERKTFEYFNGYEMSLKDTLGGIIGQLNTENLKEIENGVNEVDQLLRSLASSIQKLHTSGSMDSRLASFVSLQDNFQYNLSSALLSAYRDILQASDSPRIETILKINTCLMGLLLVHPESRNIFGKKANMLVILGFLDPDNEWYLLEICASFVSLLIHILLFNLRNMRVFEACGGCLTIIHLLQYSPAESKELDTQAALQQNLHFKVVEFLIFYMTDEKEFGDSGGVPMRSVAEKASFIKPDFPAIEDLIDTLNDLSTTKTTISRVHG